MFKLAGGLFTCDDKKNKKIKNAQVPWGVPHRETGKRQEYIKKFGGN